MGGRRRQRRRRRRLLRHAVRRGCRGAQQAGCSPTDSAVDGADVAVARRRHDVDAEQRLRPSDLLRRHLHHGHLLRARARRVRLGERPHSLRRLRRRRRPGRRRTRRLDRCERLLDRLVSARRAGHVPDDARRVRVSEERGGGRWAAHHRLRAGDETEGFTRTAQASSASRCSRNRRSAPEWTSSSARPYAARASSTRSSRRRNSARVACR